MFLKYASRHKDQVLPESVVRDGLLKTLNTLFSWVDNNPVQDWQKVQKLAPHVKKLIDQSDVKDPNTDIILLHNKLGAYLGVTLNSCKESLDYKEKALKMYLELYQGNLYPVLAASLNNVGLSYRELGGRENVEKGLRLLEEGLTMRQELYQGKLHPDLAASLNNVGLAYGNLGGRENMEKGLRLLKEALSMRHELYQGQPHPDLASSLNNVGLAYGNLGSRENMEKGLGLLEEALTMMQELYQEKPHSDVARLLNNVGITYKKLGEIEKGEKYLKQAREMEQALNQNPTGEGVENYENVSYWNKYAKEGLEHLLKLRIEVADIKDVVVKGLNLVWSDSLTVTEKLCSDISKIVKTEQGTMLLPLNLYGKHWTGLVVDKTADKINIHYMDSEQQPISALLKEMLIKALTITNPDQQINITGLSGKG
jgi:tetratricopeptide (TPR) repeat protein